MLSLSFRMEIEEALDALQAVAAGFDEGSEKVAEFLRKLVPERTPLGAVAYAPGHPGLARASWGQVERHSGGFSFENPVDYMEKLEFGYPFKKPGPRTMAYQGGIYSKQAPGGILRPLVDDLGLLEQLADILVGVLERRLSRA